MRHSRVPLSRSQRNIYTGVLQDGDVDLYLIGRSYRFVPVDLDRFRTALRSAISTNPVQLCVLAGADSGDYPELECRLTPDEIIRVQPDGPAVREPLTREWSAGITGVALARYTVRTDGLGRVCGLDAHTHHIVLDGAGTGKVERDLAVFLTAPAPPPAVSDGMIALAGAHRREADKVDGSVQRLTAATRRELTEDVGAGQLRPAGPPRGPAGRGVLAASVRVAGSGYERLVALSERERVPLNSLIAAAATAVLASIRHSTEALLVHTVDNRFGDSALDVATCLVNSVAHTVRFPAFASVGEVARSLDRGYVTAVRRRWLREEQFRRIYMAVNRTAEVDALTLNFLPEPCAPELRRFLNGAPTTTDIGPLEGLTVATVVDAEARSLQLSLWQPAGRSGDTDCAQFAARTVAALEQFPALWEHPMAMTVGQWRALDSDGRLTAAPPGIEQRETRGSAWFVEQSATVAAGLARRPYVTAWLGWFARNRVARGEVLVCADDDTDRAVDLLLAAHLYGCGYSPCESADQLDSRASAIVAADDSVRTRVIDLTEVDLGADIGDTLDDRVAEHLAAVVLDPLLGDRIAYIMPTSGSTGEPKLVCVQHKSLAAFVDAVTAAYGWESSDTVLQCAPLTSDISVEEIFGGMRCGARLIRSTAMRSGDLPALVHDIARADATLVDIPTAIWHLLCDDPEALADIDRSRLRQVVVGGEAIRPAGIRKWMHAVNGARTQLMSSYGPTETTVVVSYLPIGDSHPDGPDSNALRVGRPVIANTVFVVFGEIVIVGAPVAAGYLGLDSANFGVVVTPRGERRPAFATSDRVVVDGAGYPVFAGRKDAVVKVAGKRVDTAEVSRLLTEDADMLDLAVEVRDGGLGVWFETASTRAGRDDHPTAGRIRNMLSALGISSFFVTPMVSIPRKPGGKVDSGRLPEASPVQPVVQDCAAGDRAAELAGIWSSQLGRPLGPVASLLDEGIGSLDLIKILPATRRHLGWGVTIFDLISADTAATLVEMLPVAHNAMDPVMVAEIADDLDALDEQAGRAVRVGAGRPERGGTEPIVVLGASGILGTGFAEALLSMRSEARRCPEVTLAMRSEVPSGRPWDELRELDGVRLVRLASAFGTAEIEDLLGETSARILINGIGSANMLVPYRDLRPANLDVVPMCVDACLRVGARLVHLSTSVLADDVTAPRVLDPRQAPYPYAAVKAVAELVVSRAPKELDYTMVRLPRILGSAEQLRTSNDILVSMVDACVALDAYPTVAVTEEVTTGRAAAQAILDMLPGIGVAEDLGRSVTALRGQRVEYGSFLATFVPTAIDVQQWKARLDASAWAHREPRRWSIIDAWLTLGARLAGRSYAEFLADFPYIALDVDEVRETSAPAQTLRDLLAQQYAAGTP